jgi:hypothetical protein
MPRILRINDPEGDPIGSAESIPGLARLLEGVPPGRYHTDEIRADHLPSGHTSRRWGFAIIRPDSSMSIVREVFQRSASRTCDDRSTRPDWD